MAGARSSRRGAPRAASGSPPETDALSARRAAYPACRRLRTPAQYAAVAGRDGLQAGATWRAGGRYLAVQARIAPISDLAPVSLLATSTAARARFGITVGKRHARRAVDRALVKRVLREAARHAAPELEAAAGERAVDVVLRLKAPCPDKAALPRPRLKAALRAEADRLCARLAEALRKGAEGTA